MEIGSTTAITSWERGRFDTRDRPHKLLFGRMYEDAAIELRVFRPAGRVFCVASAGCTAIQLAVQHGVVAVDLNPVQLAYLQRRLAGGPMERGSAERLMAFARMFRLLLGWDSSHVREFLGLYSPAEQIAYWRRHLDTRRFRAGLHFLFSLPTLRLIYSASLLASLPADFATVLRQRLERGFARHPNCKNPYIRALFLGEGKADEETPFAGKPHNSREIQLVHADAADYLECQPAQSFDGFALSNVLDGADAAYGRRLFAAVKRAAAPGAMAVLRSFRDPPFAMPTNCAGEDRAMIWGIVDVRAVVIS